MNMHYIGHFMLMKVVYAYSYAEQNTDCINSKFALYAIQGLMVSEIGAWDWKNSLSFHNLYQLLGRNTTYCSKMYESDS